MRPPNPITSLDAGFDVRLHIGRCWPGTSEFLRYRDVKLHSALFGWSNPDQTLRVAAGILGKRASGGWTQALGSAARGAKPSRQCIEPGSLDPG